MVFALGVVLAATRAGLCTVDSMGFFLQRFGALGGQPGVSTPNCFTYSTFNRCQPPNFMASAPTMRPIGSPARSRSRTSKQMCQPAAPHEMKRRSMLCHSVRRVPPPEASSSHRISLYSSILGASARVTLVSETCGVPTQVSFTVPTVPRLPSTSKGAHSRRCAGSVSACQTFSGEWRSSLTRMSVHFSPSFRTCALLAGPGVYCSRSVTFFSLFSFSLVLSDFSLVLTAPCGPGAVREHLREQTRTGGTEPATHPALEVIPVSAGRDGAVRPPWIPRSRPGAALAGALTPSAASYQAHARFLPPTVVTRPAGSILPAGSAPQ